MSVCALCEGLETGGCRKEEEKKSEVGTSGEDLDMVDGYVMCYVLRTGRRRREWKRVHLMVWRRTRSSESIE